MKAAPGILSDAAFFMPALPGRNAAYRGEFHMSSLTDAVAAAVNAASAGGGDNPGGAGETVNSSSTDFEKRIGEMVSRAVHQQLSRLIKKELPVAVEAQLSRIANIPDPNASEKSASSTANSGATGKVSASAVNSEELKALKKQIEALQRESQEKEQRILDTRLRAEVQAKLADHLGAKSPWVKRLMDSIYDVEKRFALGEDGTPVMKVKREWGEDQVPIETGLKSFFESEGKDLIPAKTAGLPPAGFGQFGRGQGRITQDGASQSIPEMVNGRPNPIASTAREMSFSNTIPGFNEAIVPGTGNNGSNK